MLILKRFWAPSTPRLEPDWEDAEGIELDMVAVRHAVATDRVMAPLQVDVDAWRSNLDTLSSAPERARNREAWRGDLELPRRSVARKKHHKPVGLPFVLPSMPPAESRIDEREWRERQIRERIEQRRLRDRVRELQIAWALQHPGEFLASGDLILTCDGCKAFHRTRLYHRGGAASGAQVGALRASARAAGWSTEKGDYCPECLSRRCRSGQGEAAGVNQRMEWHRPAVWEMTGWG